MVLAVLADEKLRQEFLHRTFPGDVEVIFADSLSSLLIIEADAYFDLEFNYDSVRMARLRQIRNKPLVVNSVIHTCKDIGLGFIRINGWPTFLQRPIAEISVADHVQPVAVELFSRIGWQCQVVPDVPGLITPRIVSMIINEAAYAFSEGVSTKEEIDLAMKTGTNYPFGPFEWLDKIGHERVSALLKELGRNNNRYTIAPELQNEHS